MVKTQSLTEMLRNSVLVMDGAMATALYDKGFYINRSFEELSLTESGSVREVAQGFRKSGAHILHTNTFGASVPKLTTYGLQDQLESILKKSVEIAKSVTNGNGFVLGLMGPLGVLVEPLGPTSVEEATDFFKKNVDIFVREGVDGIAVNGLHDLNELRSALSALKDVKIPVFAAIGVQENLKTSYGHTLEEFVKLADEFNVTAVGICGEVGPSGMLTAIEHLRPLTQKPIYALPNAGLPRFVNDQYIYLCSADYIGKYAKRFVQAGANMVGGHCGVYDQHIKAISNAVKMTQRTNTNPTVGVVTQVGTDEPLKPVSRETRSLLGRRLANKERVVTVEIVPPFVSGFNRFVEQCTMLQEGGIEFVNIPDGARAVARMSSLQLSAYVKNKFKLEPIPHLTCRDRNLIGLQADILGSYVNGVRNLLIVTGDPPKLGNTPGATAVYDVDAIGLTHIVSRMNQGLDLGGTSTGEQTQFLVGVALNPTTKNRELEIKRFKYKIEAGADYVITQPIYSVEAYKEFFDELGPVSIPIIMGIWPLISLRNAEFLKYEVPGVDVPDWVIEEMKKAGDDKEEAIKRGVDIAVRTMTEAKKLVAGFEISAPFNKVAVALDVNRQVFG